MFMRRLPICEIATTSRMRTPANVIRLPDGRNILRPSAQSNSSISKQDGKNRNTGHKCLILVSGVYLIDNLQISAKMRHSVRNFVLRFFNHLIINVVCGVREIRTPDTLSGYTNFPGLPLQPLEHHSIATLLLAVLFNSFAAFATA